VLGTEAVQRVQVLVGPSRPDPPKPL
jgi:hypothetical protein